MGNLKIKKAKRKNSDRKTRIEQLVEEAKMNLAKEPKPPPVVLKVQNKIFGTLGDFTLVIGKAKSKKTFLISLALASLVSNKSTNSEIFNGKLPKGKEKVVFVDTEQSRGQVFRVAQRVSKLAGITKIKKFEVYSLRKNNTKERTEIIEHIINTTTDLGVLVIDGVRDLVTSINDEQQATELTTKLLKWTDEKRIHVITVLHQNKSNQYARGHLGTELINKAELTVSVKVNNSNRDISSVSIIHSRYKHFDPFAFKINENGLPEMVSDWNEKTKVKKSKKPIMPENIDQGTHFKILNEVKKQLGDRPGYTDVWKQIKSVGEKFEIKIGNSKAKNSFLQFYVNEGYIKKHGKDRSPNTYYSIQVESLTT